MVFVQVLLVVVGLFALSVATLGSNTLTIVDWFLAAVYLYALLSPAAAIYRHGRERAYWIGSSLSGIGLWLCFQLDSVTIHLRTDTQDKVMEGLLILGYSALGGFIVARGLYRPGHGAERPT